MKSLVETLESGYKVVMVPCEAESVAVGFFVGVGSCDETPAEAGVSHFIEHMLFKGTKRRSAADIVRSVEGRGGNFNAFTSEEATCYYVHMPSEYLAEAIDILSDMYLNASLPSSEFEREKSVIIEEIKMYDDDPSSVAMENLQAAVFKGCPLGSPVAGSVNSLIPMKVSDLSDYKSRHYLPSNTVIVVVGAFSPDQCIKNLEKSFANENAPREGKHQRAFKIPRVKKASSTVAKRDIKQVQLAMGYRVPGTKDKRKYVATLVDAVLGRGMSSRLFQEVREKRGLSYDISSRVHLFNKAGLFTISAGLDVSRIKTAYDTILSEISKIRSRRISNAELKRTKEFLTGNFRLAHERVTAKLFYYGSSMLAFGRVMPVSEQVESVLAVTPDDILQYADEFFAEENCFASWVVPSGEKDLKLPGAR